MKRKTVNCNSTNEKVVKIMMELDGKPVNSFYQHHESTKPQKATYEVILTSEEAE